MVTIYCFWDHKNCNRNAPRPVLVNSVDALSTITWMILVQARWWKPRYGMTMKLLANWFAASIRWWRKWSARIGRGELLRRTFAK